MSIAAKPNDGNMKVVGGATAAATLSGLGTLAVVGNLGPMVWAVIIGGLSVVVLLIVGYIVAVKLRMRNRAASADKSLLDMMRLRPRSVNDPVLIARLDQLSEKFEHGVQTFYKATGQRVSESPWYLLVGEPGSGKTEAIRRCGVEFPSGLHEEQQGAGGTTNMDWWFTEEAVILDTAGRYALDAETKGDADHSGESIEQQEVARAQTDAEWSEFLRLVSKTRPHCPVNGLLLVIPATSLIKDDSDDLQAKAKHLAKFLDHIRRTLEVRFPVFVLITKSDLIPGFREFFEHIKDPALQSQMLGWTKSGSLDEPFDPAEVEKYLKSVRDRLVKRRFALIQDPVHTEVPGARRADQVDALYTFPDRFAAMAPKLRKYLQMVFVKNKFNQNPLFLRGIYFTSSMEQGAALDETLAKIRGITIQQLEDEERAFRRDRPIFLRDLFMRKVFVENGLVTRESNVRQAKRKRQVVAMVSGMAAVLLLGAFLAYSFLSFQKSIGTERTLVSSLTKDDVNRERFARSLALFGPDETTKQLVYRGGKTVSLIDPAPTLEEFYSDRIVVSGKPLEVPGLFRLFQKNVDLNRKAATDALLKAFAVAPVTGAAVDLMARIPDTDVNELAKQDWGKDGVHTKALATLLAVESPEETAFRSADSLIRFTLNPKSEGFDTALTFASDNQDALPRPASAMVASNKLTEARKRGINAFVNHWQNEFDPSNTSSLLYCVTQLDEKLRGYAQTLASIEELSAKRVNTAVEYRERRTAFRALVAELGTKRNDVKAAYDVVQQRLSQRPTTQANGTFGDRIRASVAGLTSDAEPTYRTLRSAASSSKASTDQLDNAWQSLKKAINSTNTDALLASISDQESKYLTESGGIPAYQSICSILETARDELVDIDGAIHVASENGELSAAERVQAVGGKTSDETRLGISKRLALHVIANWAQPAIRYVQMRAQVDQLPSDTSTIANAIAERAQRSSNTVPDLPKLNRDAREELDQSLARFDFSAAKTQVALLDAVHKALDDTSPTLDRDLLQQEYEKKQAFMADYWREYVRFWKDFESRLQPEPFADWADFRKFISTNGMSDRLRRTYLDLNTMRFEALHEVPKLNDAVLDRGIRTELGALDERKGRIEGELAGAIKKAIANWNGLGDKHAAVTKILGMRPDEFVGSYFVDESDAYIYQLFLNGLKALAAGQDGAMDKNIDNARNFQQMFPLRLEKLKTRAGNDWSPHPEEVLGSRQKLEEAKRAIEMIVGVANAQDPGRLTIGDGNETQIDEINQQLRNLRPNRLGDQERQQLARSLQLVDSLLRIPAKAAFRLKPIEPPEEFAQSDFEVRTKKRYQLIHLDWNGKQIDRVMKFEAHPGWVLPTAPAELHTYEIRFRENAADEKGPNFRLSGTKWFPLEILRFANTRTIDQGKTWQVRLVFYINQIGYAQWFEIKFDDSWQPPEFLKDMTDKVK